MSRVRQLQEQAQQVGFDLMGLLFPSRCGGCGRVDEILCQTCRAAFEPLQPPLCPRCGQQAEEEPGLCARCAHEEPPYAAGRAVFVFADALREAVHAFKFEDRPELAAPLAEAMVCELGREWIGEQAIDVVLPLPLHPAREAARGYNQARLLAEALAAAWELPVLSNAVRRVRDTRSQVGLNLQERRGNVRGAFGVAAEEVSGLHVLLVDDVRTSGATLEACCMALLDAGAASVRVLTLAQAV